MRRVVVTGLGIVSSIGGNKTEVLESLKNGTSGIGAEPSYTELGFRSQVAGQVKCDVEALLDRKERRFLGDCAAYATIAMKQAIEDSGLEEHQIVNERTGIIAGSGGPSTKIQTWVTDTTREKGPKRVGPTQVPKIMSSTVSANLATMFKIKGVNYSITSACSTSAHCIGNAAEMIQYGKQDIMFAGGGEELDWSLSVSFDAMGAMSSKYNETPSVASRAYDANRDGFVISGGGGMLVLEEYEHAKARGAKIYAEVVGYGATSDGADMVAPSGEGAERCMRQAMATIGDRKVQYINAHGTSTPVGDSKEIGAVRGVFGDDMPYVSSTKSLTGHALGAAGVNESIYSLLMLEEGFLAASAHIEELDPEFEGVPILRENHYSDDINCVLSNSFGFGGTNCSLIFAKV
ncbi:MAG: beta-ketoacyl-ACP synthase I [Alphaproteobacteria bacterium]